MSITRVVNPMNTFLGQIQRGAKTIQTDLTAAKDMLAGGILADQGLAQGMSTILNNIDWKTKLVLGSITVGGISAAAWGIDKVIDEEDEENIENINQHFSQVPRLSIHGK
jgi:hypothetical protein